MGLYNEIRNRVMISILYALAKVSKGLVYLGFKTCKYGIIDYFEFEGIPFSRYAMCEDRARAMLTYDNFRPDDIIVFTFIKSGTHFTRDVLASIYKEKGIKLSNCFFELKVPKVLESTALDHTVQATGPLADAEKAFSPRVFTTHVPWNLLPPKAKAGKVKMVCCHRNPKDVMCSLFPFYTKLGVFLPGTSWDDFVVWFSQGNTVYGNFFNFIKEWYPNRKNETLLNLTYEDMKKDLKGNVKKIVKFLDMELTEEQIDRVVHANTFENKKKEMGNHHVMYRKGTTGAWKNEISVAQNEMLDEWIQRETEGLDDYNPDFE